MPQATSASALVFEMKPAAIYARFSTELQNEKSTEDQIALCRGYAVRHQLDVVATFEDKARSGASVFGRNGLMQLMDAARQHRFTVVIVEALDRLSRDMEDLAGIHKRLSFQGIEIQAVHDGTADSILIGIRGLVGQMQREDGAKKSAAAWPAWYAMADTPEGAPTDIERYPANPASSKSSKTKLRSSGGFLLHTQPDEGPEKSRWISIGKISIHREVGDGMRRQSTATPSAGPGSSSMSSMLAVLSGTRSGW